MGTAKKKNQEQFLPQRASDLRVTYNFYQSHWVHLQWELAQLQWSKLKM